MSDTTLKVINFPPGVFRDSTEYGAEGRWYDCNLIRFRNQRTEKMGGCVKETVSHYTDSTNRLFTGIARAILSWSNLASQKFVAVAGSEKVELFTENLIYDVTPIRESVSLTNAITTNATTTIRITDVNHNLSVGDYIFVTSQGSAVDGITLDGEYVVQTVIDADNYTILVGSAASGSTSGGGGTLEIDYLLPIGSEDNGSLTGWGGGTWDTEGAAGGGWSRPRAGVGGLDLRQWSLDNWGEDFIACPRGGGIYHWDATSGETSRLAILSSAPTENSFILVSQPSRHLIAFGSQTFGTTDFDPLVIRWAEQETLNSWEITATNTAGEFRLPKGNKIVGAVQTRREILIFTETDLYAMRYVGGDDIFQIEPLGTNISAISQHSFVDVNGVVIWQGLDNYYIYDGVVQILPTTIGKYLFDESGEGRINFSQKEKVYAGINKEFNEIIFFYPRFDNTENSHYVKYNLIEQAWDYGTLARTVWLDKGTFQKPYAIDETGKLLIHESSNDLDGAPMNSFIKSAYFDIEDGENLLFVDRVLPDLRLAPNRAVDVSLFYKKYPHPAADVVTKGPYTFSDNSKKISTRGRGRQMAIQIASNSTGADWEIGKIRIGLQPDGER